jgi:cation:H+ antiporter
MTQHILELIAGVLLAWWGGEWFVRALVTGAKWARIPAGMVGVTLAAFATSAPELAVGVQSASAGAPQISLGDTLGSNVANIALFLAFGLLLSRDRVPSATARRDFTAALLTPVLVALVAMDGFISRADAVILLLAFFGWLSVVTRDGLRTAGAGARDGTLERRTIMLGIAGLLLLFLAGHFIVVGSRAIAEALEVNPFIIGTVLVAVATGTPELATTLVAKFRGHHDLGVGNIYGSNIFNAWLILPIAALICPIQISDTTEVLVTLGFGVVTTISTHTSRGVLGRDRGLLLLAQYVGFLAILWVITHRGQ